MLLNEDPSLTRPHFDEDMAVAMAAHYDRLGIRVVPVLVRDALAGHFPPQALARLRDASAHPQCRIVADWIHNMSLADVPAVRRSLERARGATLPPETISTRRIDVRGPDIANGPSAPVTAVLFEWHPGA